MTAPSILLIEDDRRIAMTLQIRLRAAGYDVYHAPTGSAGLDQFAARSPDLVVLDIRLPDIDGFEVCERIRRTESTGSTKILFLSANAQPASRARAQEVGGDRFLSKTCGGKEVMEAIQALLADQVRPTVDSVHDDSPLYKESGDARSQNNSHR